MNRILVVEDDESLDQLLAGLRDAVPACPPPVITRSGEEALHLLDREDFDIVLVDLTLPGMDGIELLVRTRELHPQVKTYAMTSASASSSDLTAAALGSGAAEILRKPLDFHVLLGAVTRGSEESGRLISLDGDFDAADLCLLGALTGRAGGIQAKCDGAQGVLLFADGALVHASTRDLQGLAAVKRILGWEPLEFDWISAASASHLEPNIRLDTGWLLKIANWRQRPLGDASEPQRATGLLSGVLLADLLDLLEKKRESGTMTVTANGLFGVLVLRDGEVVQADTDKAHGPEALQEIRSWSAIRATFNAERSDADEPDGSAAARRLTEDLAKLLNELMGEISDILAMGILRISDESPLVESVRDPLFTAALSAYASAVKGHLLATELIGRGACGPTEDLLITLEKGYLLIRMLGPDHFHGAILTKSANPALTRFLMQRVEPLFLAALDRAAGP